MQTQHTPYTQQRAWGFWPTIGFGILIVTALVIIEFLVLGTYVLVELIRDPQADRSGLTEELATNGLFVAITTFIIAPIVIGLVAFFIRLRKGYSIRQYLSISKVRTRPLIRAIYLTLLLVFVLAIIGTLMDTSDSDWQTNIYENAPYLPLLWIAIVLVAPIYEEVVFRGFLFTGIQESKLGPLGAILITSFGWAILHFQYNIYGITTIFVLGLAFGFARLRTKSIVVPTTMHIINNLISMIGLALYTSS
ncbi:MAG: CPBP family intramembrane glutamic endopeptidase [Chloroflexota bacterium]|nr:CPBP family intramembrane glutamic endopeptidase [Chloroflexota bacterium]